jgi:hypothetical protein
VWVCGKVAPPIAVADDQNRVGTWFGIFLRSKEPAQFRHYTKYVK